MRLRPPLRDARRGGVSLLVRVVAVTVMLALTIVSVGLWNMTRLAGMEVGQADAVVVHAPHAERLETGLALVKAGVARVLVISYVGPAYDRSVEDLAALCDRDGPYEVICIPPIPVNTIGEARAFGLVAEARGWRSVAIVSDHLHLPRARLSVRQCTDAEVLPVVAQRHEPVGFGELLAEALRVTATVTLIRACW